MTRAQLWRLVQIAFTVLLVALLWSAADGPEILRVMAGAQPVWLLLAVGMLIGQTVLSACRWKLTAAQLGQSLPLPHAIREYFMSQIINQALPGAVVGDAARAVRARTQAGLTAATQAVVFERLAGQIAMFATMAFAFIVTYFWAGGLDWPASFAAPLGFVIILTIAVCAFSFLGHSIPENKRPQIIAWMGPLHKALFSKQVLPAQICMGAAITLCNLAAFGLCGWAIGVQLSLAALCALVPVILFSMLIPLTVSGWGIREGSAAVLLPLAGIPAAESIATSVMFGIAMVLAVTPGLIMMVGK